MSLLILFTLFAPLIFSFFFAGLETQSRIFSSRTFLFASFGLFAILVSLGISNYFMDYLIELYSFIDIRSLSHNDLPSWLVVISTFLVLAGTLMLLTFMGDAMRDAFDTRRAKAMKVAP